MQAHYYPTPPPPKKSNAVLIVLLIVGGVVLAIVAVIAILGVLAVTGTRKYVNASKAAEATNTVGQISRDAVEAYERESLDPSGGAVSMHALCPSASRPVPATIGDVCGKKYMATQSDWQADMAKNGGFYCLKFEMSMPQYYQYDYKAAGTGKVGDSFTATAKGDLDCDAETSTFSVTGNVKAGEILVLEPMKQTDPEE